ncbi:hypothetical protein BVL54_15235 [Bacillus paralicheniformis]|nr:hypothetical protein BVL54_15235 [Bacillus paralicheniformis]
MSILSGSVGKRFKPSGGIQEKVNALFGNKTVSKTTSSTSQSSKSTGTILEKRVVRFQGQVAAETLECRWLLSAEIRGR